MASPYIALAKTSVDGIDVLKLKSKKTGILVYLAQVNGPSVDGFVCLATEAHDHDGLPHTLEHLVFMGSETYPYKGVLDLLANRCLAQGTNAWTDVDHTCYTVTTAGSEGFLNLLPIYLDHILYPTLTNSAYLTEVHHVNGEGEDAGVVYCEMQARENTAEDMTHFELLQRMYPGQCGYKSETGGRLENLRNSTSNEKVRSYHASYYRPDNLAVIVVGKVTPEEVFQAISEFESKVESKGHLPYMERPWQSLVPPLVESADLELPYPAEDEAVGMVRVGWRGPKAKDRYELTAVETLLSYLCDTSVAPLQKNMVEVTLPFCSKIKPLFFENSESCVGFTFTGVPADKLEQFKEKLFSVLGGVVSGEQGVDVTRMRTMIRRSILKNLESLEQNPDYYFAFGIIGDFLFADRADEFAVHLDKVPHLKQLLAEPVSFWRDLLHKYFIAAPHILVRGKPSVSLSEKMNLQEKDRLAQQQSSLGEDALKRKEEELEEAMENNEILPPMELISSLAVPDPSCISTHPVCVVSMATLTEELARTAEYSLLPVDKLPFAFQLNQIQSSFVELVVVMDTSVVPVAMRQYINLLLELLFESPIARNGELIPYEQVVQQLAEDTVSTHCELGHNGSRFVCGEIAQAAFVTIKVEAGKYSKGVAWLEEVLYKVQIVKERISVAANKVLNSAADLKRKGREIARAMSHRMNLQAHSSHNLGNMMAQSRFLQGVLDGLSSEDRSGEVIASLTQVRDLLTAPSNLRVYMSGDVRRAAAGGSALQPWEPLISRAGGSCGPLPNVPSTHTFHEAEVWGKSCVAGVGGVDSSYLVLSLPSITDHNHVDYPAILVFMEYLCCLEGPMWRQIRGMGLSYHYSMRCHIEAGFIRFILFRAAQVVQAFEEAKKIMDGFVSGETPFDPVQLESAVSAAIFEIVEREKTVSDAGHEAVMASLRGTSFSYNKELLQAVSKVTIDQLRYVGERYFSKLFCPEHTSCAVCCTVNKVEEIREMLAGLGWKVTVVKELEDMLA